RGRRTWRQRGVLVLGSVVATTCLLGAAVVGYGWARWRSVDRVGLDTDAVPAGEPVNFLLVGSDSRAREGAAEQEAVEGQRTDTIMVLRLDPAAEEVSVLSFPRDLWVPIAGRGESARINTAYDAPGRQQVLVDTIREDFGIEINHWIEVDFEGFRQLVDAIGGVTLYFDRALRDRGSGLYVEQLGCVTLDGDAALAYARSRKAEYHTEDGWVRDPQSDLSRIVRQQTLMTEALHTALAEADDPVRLNELVDIAAANVTIDDELTLGDVRELADRLGSLDDDALRTVSLPVLPRPGDEGSTLVVDEEAAAPVVAEFRGGEPTDVSPADIDVTVLNGTVADPARQRQGLAGDVTAGLEQVGFATSPPGDAGEVYETTVVRYASGQLTSGQRVAQHLTGGVALEEDRSLAPGEVTVVAGVDFTTVHEEPTPLDRLPAPPSDATTERGDGTEDPGADTEVHTTTAAQPTTTSPALVGAVPDGAC
ncbi:MAG TPA: LCP family protein, partial [Acidimicrobiales bacterium]|nr:LCP family protein [Acidimicrobiales bacterium]